MAAVAECGERGFEVFHHGTADKARAPDCSLENFREFLFEFDVWSYEIEKRNAL
jgi:hypothetical protein